MATKHIEQQHLPTTGYEEKSFYLVCGPVEEERTLASRKVLREHPAWVLILGAFGGYLLVNLWALYDYAGGALAWKWRCELLAAVLSLLTIYLFATFRRWGQARIHRTNMRRERLEEFHTLLCTPPPLADTTPLQQAEKEYFLSIERWASQEAYCWSEEQCREFKLPDEFLAPDALVLNVEFKEAA